MALLLPAVGAEGIAFTVPLTLTVWLVAPEPDAAHAMLAEVGLEASAAMRTVIVVVATVPDDGVKVYVEA